ncbi:MAG: flagellar hook basal-body protein [Planctomycetes bacterium]|nr:flagellar hook basal-body protein [Planctomycetota bacterium]MCK5473273.1 flagellar hook basal-body protein [Planctomycetota bacterium]
MSEITEKIGSSINALTQEFNIITHNLANVSTVGYKRRCNTFSKHLESQKAAQEVEPTNGFELNSTFDFSQGPMVETGRPLDFAISGNGFFVVETTEGELYTRNGMFQVNQNGQIVDTRGRIISGENGPITIPGSVGLAQLNVANDGTISAGGASMGKFRIVDFQDMQSELVAVGGSCFSRPQGSEEPEPAESAVVKQGYQESSNVQMVEEMVDMIMVSRLYEANMRFISAGKDRTSSLMNVAMG